MLYRLLHYFETEVGEDWEQEGMYPKHQNKESDKTIGFLFVCKKTLRSAYVCSGMHFEQLETFVLCFFVELLDDQ